MQANIEPGWQKILAFELEKSYFVSLTKTVSQSYKSTTVYPDAKSIFSAFTLCPFSQVKVVILGQDPYHGANQAQGLSFSVPKNSKLPPSLRNIYKELKNDLGIDRGQNGDLSDWAKQGILMLNATLTVEAGKPGSHQGLGWEKFTDAVIKTISEKNENVVFVLWGKYAEAKADLIDNKKHLIITSPHPSPFSAHRGFFGSKPFSQINAYLSTTNQKTISW